MTTHTKCTECQFEESHSQGCSKHTEADYCMTTDTLTAQLQEEARKEFVEKGASLEHVRWSKWQNYLHSFLVWNSDVQAWVLPHEKKAHWQRQMETYYGALSEKEKESDKEQVRAYLPLLNTLIATAVQRAREEILEDIIKHLGDDRNFDFLMSNTKGKVIPFKSCGDTNCQSPYCKKYKPNH